MVSLKAVKMNAGDLTTRDNSRLTSMEYATEYMLAVHVMHDDENSCDKGYTVFDDMAGSWKVCIDLLVYSFESTSARH